MYNRKKHQYNYYKGNYELPYICTGPRILQSPPHVPKCWPMKRPANVLAGTWRHVTFLKVM